MFKFLLLLPVLTMALLVPGCFQDTEDMESKASTAKIDTATPEWELFSKIDVLRRQSYCPAEDHKLAKAKLIKIFEADVEDRKSFNETVSARDLNRRIEVSKIAAKGCLFDQEDYWIAALIYQHGQVPEHYLQAIIYANKSSLIKKTGKLSSDRRFQNIDGLQQVAIDRYLTSLGYQQLFGTQIISPAYYKQFESEADGQPCVWPVDKSFDVTRDYKVGTDAYRQMLDAQISAKLAQFGVCKFPALSSKHLLEHLLKTEI